MRKKKMPPQKRFKRKESENALIPFKMNEKIEQKERDEVGKTES